MAKTILLSQLAYLAVILMFATTLLRTGQFHFQNPPTFTFKEDQLSQFESNMMKLKPILTQQKYVGYWSKKKINEGYWMVKPITDYTAKEIKDYYYTQYTLAPTLLVPLGYRQSEAKRYSFIVGLGLDPIDIAGKVRDDKKLILIKNLPQKTYLFQMTTD